MSIRIGDRIISGSGGAADGESLINQNTSSSIEKVYNWVGTIAEYEEQDVANIHPDWVCYIIDDEAGDDEEYEVYEISGRNVGDIFFTSRKDLNLNGAVECDGGVYNLSDYTGVESIEELLKSNKLPYVSISEYNTLLETNGSVGVFGWDGNSASTFRVPTLNEVFIESDKVSTLGDFIKPGLPNITGVAGGDEFPHTIEIAEGVFYNAGRAYDGTAGSQYESYKLGFDASRSNSIYGSSDTVQPQSVCYRPMVQLATGIKEESIYNIENHALFDNRITNCITHIPQDIKLELNNETLTLKAGSKVYVPNSVGVFDTITIASDLTCTAANSATYLLFYVDNSITMRMVQWCFSGTEPSTSQTYIAWYDTTNNLMKYRTNSTTWYSGASLPLAIITVSNGAISSIDQVFNGFGFIGSTVFALPGIKGLMPDGRNEDGTLKNKLFTKTKVNTYTSFDRCIYIINSNNDISELYNRSFIEQEEMPTSDFKGYWYKPSENRTYRCDLGEIKESKMCKCLYMHTEEDTDHAKITKIEIYYPFRAIDYNNTEYMVHQAMPSDKYVDLTLGASGTLYTAPADGYLHIRTGTSANEAGWISVVTDIINQGLDISRTGSGRITIPIRKGQSFTINYGGTTLALVRFIYAEGSK